MRAVDSHSFNNSVLEQINTIKQLLNRITPDNINYFDDNLLRKARGVVNTASEYKWNYNSTINSISVRTIIKLTEFLKISGMEYNVLSDAKSWYRVVPILEVTDDQQQAFASIKIDIPSKYDGRNSFVKLILIDGKGRYINELKYVNYGIPATTQIVKNVDKIEISIALPIYSENSATEDADTEIKAYVFAVCWRKK